MLTMIAPGRMPSSSLSSAIPSRVSWTGISSSTVTKWTTVCGDRITFCTVSAWPRIGPTLARPETSAVTFRNRPIRPVGGASMTTAS